MLGIKTFRPPHKRWAYTFKKTVASICTVKICVEAAGFETACNNADGNVTPNNDSTANTTKEDRANKASLELVFSDNSYQITGVTKLGAANN